MILIQGGTKIPAGQDGLPEQERSERGHQPWQIGPIYRKDRAPVPINKPG
jgi:hypothetical protein